MDEPLAVALKFGFLAVLYLFLLWVARSGLRELRRSQEASEAPQAEPKKKRGRKRDMGTPGLSDAVEPRLEVVAAMGHDPGASWDIREDRFASSAPARIVTRGDFMWIEDMGSTNGTYLNGRTLTSAERLKMADIVRIGDSEYRYQE